MVRGGWEAEAAPWERPEAIFGLREAGGDAPCLQHEHQVWVRNLEGRALLPSVPLPSAGTAGLLCRPWCRPETASGTSACPGPGQGLKIERRGCWQGVRSWVRLNRDRSSSLPCDIRCWEPGDAGTRDRPGTNLLSPAAAPDACEDEGTSPNLPLALEHSGKGMSSSEGSGGIPQAPCPVLN